MVRELVEPLEHESVIGNRLTCIIHHRLLQTAGSLQYQLIGEFCPHYSLSSSDNFRIRRLFRVSGIYERRGEESRLTSVLDKTVSGEGGEWGMGNRDEVLCSPATRCSQCDRFAHQEACQPPESHPESASRRRRGRKTDVIYSQLTVDFGGDRGKTSAKRQNCPVLS